MAWAVLASEFEEMGQWREVANEFAGFLGMYSSSLGAEVHAYDRELPLSERAYRLRNSWKLPGRYSFAESVVEGGTRDGADRLNLGLKDRLY